MGFLESIASEVIVAVLAAGVVAALGWLGARLFRRRRVDPSPTGETPPSLPGKGAGGSGGEPGPLRVLVALPRPLLTLLREEDGVWVPATAWDKATGTSHVLPLKRAWKIEAIEDALRRAGAPLEMRVLDHPTVAGLRQALEEGPGYDVLIVDTHGGPDGALCFEGPHGESHPLSPADLGLVLVGGGVRLALLSACHSAAACDALRDAGVPAVVGMAEPVREGAARTYLEVFLARLARGDRLDGAHARACDALRTRWAAQPGEADLPQLSASRRQQRCRMVRPGAEGAYVRLGEKPAAPGLYSPGEGEGGGAPPAPLVIMRGRELDQVLVQRMLLTPPALEDISPLVTLAGFGGVGKTALALAVARWCWERDIFPGGVFFVSLTDLRVAEGETLADRLLREFDLPLPQVPPDQDEYRAKVAALYQLLACDPPLLLLDNFETACADGRNLALLTQLRQRCPGLHILVASRRASLNLPGGQVHPLHPLEERPAVEVFCDRAREVGRVVREAERGAVAAICALLNRIPLHIRLVASHARAERPAAILEGLHDAERRYHLTAADLPDEPAHHRSRELSFRYTYDLLDVGGKRLWAVLAAVFAGDPDRVAVRAVYGARADAALDELLDWQVVEREDGRHRMAEPVRDFGRARLVDLGLERAELRARHAAHYLAYAKDHRGDYDTQERELPDIFAGFDFVAAKPTRDDEMVAAYNWAVQDVLKVRGYWDEVLRWLSETSHACEELGDRAGLAPTYNNIGAIYDARGEYETALEWYERSLALKEELGDRAGLATTYNNIGLIHKARGEYETALEWYERSLALCEELGDRAGLATTYNNIGATYKARGEYETALEWYMKDLAISEELGDRAGLAPTYNNIGGIYDARGEYETALEWYERSLALGEELGDRAVLAPTYNNIGLIYDARGEYETALEWYERSLALKEELGDRAGLATTYSNIGGIYDARGEYETALEWYERSLALGGELGDRAGLARTYNNIGAIYKARGEYETALEWYERSLALGEELGDRAGLAPTLHNMGHIALAQGNLSRALSLFARSRDLYAEIGLEKDVAEEDEMIAEVRRRMGGTTANGERNE
ncbi:MAG: tetratricopeptide repeat protein [Chloroflexota bacterium]|nr:tetratricopeptide repeat protein [Chloroflexota bacterium]